MTGPRGRADEARRQTLAKHPQRQRSGAWRLLIAIALLAVVVLSVAGCGGSSASGGTTAASLAASTGSESPTASVPQARPQAIEPAAGVQASSQGAAVTPSEPVGDPNAHAPPLSEVRAELRMELVAAKVTNATYIDPLRYVSVWERTDQGVDATMPVGAPILAPTTVKVLAIIRDWYAGQPLVYFELLDGPDAGRVQYVAEEITDIVPGGTIVQQGQAIARFAAKGTGIEYGWSTPNGITLAVATGGYEEGQITPAGRSMRAWLNSLGANAGPNR